jgi:two-component system chemotaxis sensor kinase CheA
VSDTDDGLIDEVVAEFLVEAHEGVDQLDQDLVALEEHPTPETIASIFRTFHTIKGTCGFLGFNRLESVSHTAENLLSRLREGELQVTAEITTALLSTVDAIRSMLALIESTGSDGDDDRAELVALLTRLQEEPGATPGEGDAAEAPSAEETPPPRLGDLLIERELVSREDVELAITQQSLGDHRPLGEILVEHGVVAADEVQEALSNQAELKNGAVSESTIRVDVRLLDGLMNLVGELVLARNQIVRIAATGDHEAFAAAAQRLNHITTDLQEGVMRTRMQPIGNVWNRFPRVVRDLARSVGKQVQIEMDGADTELDKTIVEAIKDPLTHLVRNSVDHGIERPEVRSAAGKHPEGRLSLRAFHEGGQVIIEVADDGAGIDVDRVAAKAIERGGLLSPDRAAEMSRRDLTNLIFLPGLSTAAEVTNVSGRGVGMDVVKTNIERIGGVLDVASEPGVGTTFRIKIPLTLAIIPALMVGCRGGQFAIPQVNLDELVRIDREDVATEVEWIHGAAVHRLRGQLLPLVDLAQVLGVGTTVIDGSAAVNVVVLQADGRRFGLVVDDITDTQEIVVKPLGAHVKNIDTFAGATILGDGRVALILDAVGLAQHAHVGAGAAQEQEVVDDDADRSRRVRESVLIVDLGAGHRGAVMLSTVARLEQLPCAAIEASSRGPVVQYRGELLPLVSLSALAGIGTGRPLVPGQDGELDVVVWTGPAGQVGLVVDRILDIVDEHLDLSVGGDGSVIAVVDGHVTDVIDVGALLDVTGAAGSGGTSALTPVHPS